MTYRHNSPDAFRLVVLLDGRRVAYPLQADSEAGTAQFNCATMGRDEHGKPRRLEYWERGILDGTLLPYERRGTVELVDMQTYLADQARKGVGDGG